MNDKIKVLFLDIDNTLLDFDAAAAWAMEQCFQKAGLEYKSEMFAAFTEENNKIWQADGVEMEKEFRILLNLSAVPVDGAEEILTYLKEKDYCLCAASNGPYGQQINRLKKVDMLKYFAHCFVSEKVGADKPGKAFFDGCMKELPGVCPEECMMIGDSLTADITGGRAYGMSTCWYLPSVEKYKEEKLKSGKPADYIIHDLLELKKIL